MTTRIQQLFSRLHDSGRAGLVAYITGGDPDPGQTARLVRALCRGGVDLIELGVPFSDPIADGPVIQRASQRALSAGTTLGRVLDIAATIRSESDVPLLLFSYLNPLLRYSMERVARDAQAAGVDGVLVTDLPVESAERHVRGFRENGLDMVFLATPTSTPRRLERVAEQSSGFIYLVSRTGVTGDTLPAGAADGLVASLRRITTLPLAVGFGISTPDQAATAGALADAVVVGTAFMRVIECPPARGWREISKR